MVADRLAGFVRPALKDVKAQVATLESAQSFFESAVLLAMHELGVFRVLAGGPRDFAQLAPAVGGDRETLRAIVDAAVALGLLHKRGDQYRGHEDLLACLGDARSANYVGEWLDFMHVLTGPLFALATAQRTGRPPGSLVEDGGGDNPLVARMTDAMDAHARSRGVEFVDHLDFAGISTLLDLGCGPGTYALAILERFPEIRATLLDLERPIADARRLVGARGMTDSVEFVVADALQYEPSHGFDAVFLSNTLHMLGPARSRDLLRRCHGFVNPGGRLIVQAQFLDDGRTSPRWPTLINLVQRVATSEGRNHAIGETIEWLREAGFSDVEHVRFSAWNANSALVAHRGGH